ncbi:MAG: hypothetical protein IPJ65_09740 [Archangiaceae bacterium]|nr:hypothetical protein [Archangiaceae bacterium]
MTRDEFLKDPVLLWLKADKKVEGEWVMAAFRASQQMREAVVGHLVRSISRVGDLRQARPTAESIVKLMTAEEISQLKEEIALDLVEDDETWRKDFASIFGI